MHALQIRGVPGIVQKNEREDTDIGHIGGPRERIGKDLPTDELIL